MIELKRGGFKLTRDERTQAQNYSEDLLAVFPNSRINTYVVGENIGDNMQSVISVGSKQEGKVFVTTYSQLVDTAEKRLFGLRRKLSSMYNDVPGMELFNRTQLLFK